MPTAPNGSEAGLAPPKPANGTPPGIASASIPDALAALRVGVNTGLAQAEAGVRRPEHGYNEVAVTRTRAVEGAVLVGGVSAIGAGLYSIGIPKDSIVQYELAIKTDKFLVLCMERPAKWKRRGTCLKIPSPPA